MDSPFKTNSLEIIIGTYEEFLLGYKVELNDNKPVLVQSFADKSHSGSIRCVAVHKQWIATGGTDDRVFIYDMNSRSQTQILLCHEGSLNALTFTPDGTHLLSVADDGRFIATRSKTWSTEACWKRAHNGLAATHVSCHPSGKLALTLGSDLILCTWNLIKGRMAYKTNLKSHNSLDRQPDCLTWSNSGDHFTLSGPRVVEIWSTKTANVLHSHSTKSKPTCICWTDAEACVVGLEDGKIIWLSLNKDEKEFELIAHNARVKAMHSFKDYLVTSSSSGEIKLWQINEAGTHSKAKLKELAVTNIGCRPTCISILDLEQFGKDYSVSATRDKSHKETKSMNNTEKPFPSGVVIIEYDTDNEQESSKQTKASKNKPSGSDKAEEEAIEQKASEEETTDYDKNDADSDSNDDNATYRESTRTSLHDALKSNKHKFKKTQSEKIPNKKKKIHGHNERNILHSKAKKRK